MAINRIKVNTNSLNQTKVEIQDKLEKIKKDIEQISKDMDTMNSMWEGDAHEAFKNSVNTDIQFLSVVCDGIQNIIHFEDNAVTEYNKCEQQVADLIDQIKI